VQHATAQLARKEAMRRRLNAAPDRMLPIRRRVSLARWTVNATRYGMSLGLETVNAGRHGFDATPRRFNPGWRTVHLIGDRFHVCSARNTAIG
jgi:hypothetical protein